MTFLFHQTIFATLVIIIYAYTKSAPLQISFDPPANKVRLGTNLTVRCELDSSSNVDTGISVFFYCPIAPWESFCYQNCKSACAAEDPGQCPYEKQLGRVTCRTVVEQSGRVMYEYTVHRISGDWLNPSGTGFFCKSAGSRTDEVWLEEDTNEKVMTLSSTARTTTGSVEVFNSPVESVTPRSMEVTSDLTEAALIKSRNMDERTSAVLRELLVVFAIIIVFVSVSINVFCCIRCALIRQYSKCKHPPRMQNLFCMAEEIRNARIACHGLPNYWDASRPDILYQKHIMGSVDHTSQFQHLHPDQTYAQAGHFLTTAPQRNLITGNSPMLLSPDLLTSSTQQPASVFSDTNSNTSCGAEVRTRLLPTGEQMFSVTPDPSMVLSGSGRQSKTASMVLVSGPNGLQILRSPSTNTQNPLATAVATYCAQQQQNLLELRKQLTNPDFSTTVSSRGGSDGLASGLESLGNPDSAILEIDTLRDNGNQSCAAQLSGDALYRLQNGAAVNSSNLQMAASFSGALGASPSQSDSGNGSGSGQFIMGKHLPGGTEKAFQRNLSSSANQILSNQPIGCDQTNQFSIRNSDWLTISGKCYGHALNGPIDNTMYESLIDKCVQGL